MKQNNINDLLSLEEKNIEMKFSCEKMNKRK